MYFVVNILLALLFTDTGLAWVVCIVSAVYLIYIIWLLWSNQWANHNIYMWAIYWGVSYWCVYLIIYIFALVTEGFLSSFTHILSVYTLLYFIALWAKYILYCFLYTKLTLVLLYILRQSRICIYLHIYWDTPIPILSNNCIARVHTFTEAIQYSTHLGMSFLYNTLFVYNMKRVPLLLLYHTIYANIYMGRNTTCSTKIYILYCIYSTNIVNIPLLAGSGLTILIYYSIYIYHIYIWNTSVLNSTYIVLYILVYTLHNWLILPAVHTLLELKD